MPSFLEFYEMPGLVSFSFLPVSLSFILPGWNFLSHFPPPAPNCPWALFEGPKCVYGEIKLSFL